MTQYFARVPVVPGPVAEPVIEIPDGLSVQDCFAPDIAKTLFPCDASVTDGDLFDGEKFTPAPPPPDPPPVVPETISKRQFATQLAVQGDITWDECFAYLGEGALPKILADAVAKVPVPDDVNAQNKARAALMGAGTFDRHNALTIAIGKLIGKSDGDMDNLWTTADSII